MKSTRLWTTIDFQADGKFRDYVRLPISSNESAYGWIPIPIVSIRNGDGPKALIMAGNHGDEYEGQIIAMRLMREIEPADISGQIIILSAANAPAAEAGKRVSPLDGGNLNRLFPGDPRGTVTQMIAHYIEEMLLQKVDYIFDLHSGGNSLDYLPCAVICDNGDPERLKKSLAVLSAFGMKNSLIVEGSTGGDLSMVAAAQRANVIHLSTELNGGGTVSTESLSEADQGLRRALDHIGVLRRPLTDEAPAKSRFLRRLPTKQYVYSPGAGVFEPFAKPGDEVQAGQKAALIHPTQKPWLAPETVYFENSGIVLCRRVPARTQIGDCLFNIGVEVSAAEI